MQQPNGQFVNINGGAAIQQPVPAPQNQQPQPQYVVVIPACVPFEYANYKKSASQGLGAMQIVIAIFLIAINIGTAIVNYNILWIISTGWWATPFYILAGSFGIAAGINPSRCTVITTMVLSIFCCVTVISIVTQGALGLALGCDYYSNGGSCGSTQTAHNFLTSLFLVLGLVELAIALAQSVLCCQVCCKSSTQINEVAPFQYGNTNGGFLTCYMHPQAPVQTTSAQPVGQNEMMTHGGATGQNFTVTPHGGATGQNATMATEQTSGAASGSIVQPPPYKK